MIKIGTKKEIALARNLPVKVLKTVEWMVATLDEYYGEDRDIDSDDGGYILVVEDTEDFAEIKGLGIEIEKDVIPEFVDVIHCEEENYTHSLILCSN